MSSLNNFSIRIRDIGKDLTSRADRMVAQVLLVCTATVVLRTPVDTGRARANWQAKAGEPARGALPTPASPGEGSTAALSRAQAVANAYKGKTVLNITNNLPYIGPLNRGSSKQAPRNFVQAAVMVGVKKVQSSRIIR